MTVAVLQPYGLLYRIVKILCRNDTEDRHHQLFRDQRMLLLADEGDTADIIRHLHADHGKQYFRGTSHALSVQRPLRCEHGSRQLILLLFGSQITALFIYHVMQQFIDNALHCHDLLFRDTGQIVIEGTAVYHIRRRLSDIRRLVDQCGRVACPCADAPLAGGKDCRYHARASGRRNQLDRRMVHHDITGCQCRFFHRTCHIVRSSCFQRSLIYQIDGIH